MSRIGRITTVSLPLLLLTAPMGARDAASIDWNAAASPDVVRILTQNEDGSMRDTKIWIVLVDGRVYIRTGGTRWYRNVERNPNASLRTGELEHPLRVELVTDGALLQRVNDTFREKYGFSDRLAGIMRFGGTHIMRLVAR